MRPADVHDPRGYWRDLQDDATGISDYLNSVQKYVVSSTLTDPEWQRHDRAHR